MNGRRVGLLASGLLIAALLLGGAGIAVAGTSHAVPGFGWMTSSSPRGMMNGSGYPTMSGSGPNGMMNGSGPADSGQWAGPPMWAGHPGTPGVSGPAHSSTVRVSTPAAARALLEQVAATATIDRQANIITYSTQQVEMVALASPDSGPDMTWNVDGLVNPTVVIPTGAHVTVHFFDADADHMHGWKLTTTSPPYPFMVMMDTPIAFPAAFAIPVSHATAQQWYGRIVQFTASVAGTYYYLCPVPGHAQKGMHGTLIVR
jgi:rusticyanin